MKKFESIQLDKETTNLLNLFAVYHQKTISECIAELCRLYYAAYQEEFDAFINEQCQAPQVISPKKRRKK